VAFLARGPLARGLLSGKYDKNSRFDSNDIRSNWLVPGAWVHIDARRLVGQVNQALLLPPLALLGSPATPC
jgi:aryl-alcohol dehydrogenase-like predicted oxidoreductase